MRKSARQGRALGEGNALRHLSDHGGGPVRRGARTWRANGLARLFFPVFIRTMRKAEVQVVAGARRALEAHEDRAAA